MPEYNRKDIQNEIEYSFISLFSKKIRIGVVGAGRAGAIKIRRFVKNKCYVEVLAREFSKDILELSQLNNNLQLINEEFDDNFLKDKHLIIIALDDSTIKYKIKKYCDDNYKIYIDSTDFKEGMAVVPAERSSRTVNIAVSTKGGNPKGSVWAAEKLSRALMEDDDYIEFTTRIRNKAKDIPECKNEIINFVFTEAFRESFNKGKGVASIKDKFPEEIIKKLF